MSRAPLRCSVEAHGTPPGARAQAAVDRLSSRLAALGVQQPEKESGTSAVGAPVLVVSAALDDALPGLVAQRSGAANGRVLVVLLSGPDAGAWSLLQAGASDVLGWDEVTVADAVAARLERWRAVDELAFSPQVLSQMVGTSPAWRQALRRVVEVAHFTSSSLLVMGESGTGKELVARLFHHVDPRPGKGDLVVVDCTTVVASLAGSEFFGHERGAFTGAVSPRAGAFAAADGGSLFLDEVGELPLELQADLLRVLQEGTYKRLGSDLWQRTRFRLVAATNRDLDEDLVTGRFRRDLYHRIAVNVVRLPPLRERPGDVLPLFEHFLAQDRGSEGAPGLDPAVASWLQSRDYPGNVRDLRQLAARIAARHTGPGPVTPGEVPDEERPGGVPAGPAWDALLETAVRAALDSGAGFKQVRDAAADAAVALAVADAGGSLRGAAQRLGVTERALQLRRAAAQAEAQPEQAVPEQAPPGTENDVRTGQVPEPRQGSARSSRRQ